MITHKDYARQKNLTLKQARVELERKISEGLMVRKRNKGFYLYCDTTPFKWHDPFNLIERRRA
jgi:hypothetical protein